MKNNKNKWFLIGVCIILSTMTYFNIRDIIRRHNEPNKTQLILKAEVERSKVIEAKIKMIEDITKEIEAKTKEIDNSVLIPLEQH